MWDHPEFDDVADDWEPLRHRRARPIRMLAILVVIAMVLALVIPVLLRALQDDEPDETRPDGVRAAVVIEPRSVVFEDDLTLAFMDIAPVTLGHLHVLPRFRGDGFELSIRYDPPPARRTLDAQAAEMSAQL